MPLTDLTSFIADSNVMTRAHAVLQMSEKLLRVSSELIIETLRAIELIYEGQENITVRSEKSSEQFDAESFHPLGKFALSEDAMQNLPMFLSDDLLFLQDGVVAIKEKINKLVEAFKAEDLKEVLEQIDTLEANLPNMYSNMKGRENALNFQLSQCRINFKISRGDTEKFGFQKNVMAVTELQSTSKFSSIAAILWFFLVGVVVCLAIYGMKTFLVAMDTKAKKKA